MAEVKQQILDSLGISEAVGRFLLCYLATIPCCYIHRFIHNVTARHAFAALSGAVLSYLAFGISANVHFAVTLSIAYLAMRLDRKHCGLLTFYGTFIFLIACHVYYMSGDAWKGGGIDFTGALMILTLKAISVATDFQDGAAPEEALKETQKNIRLMRTPTVLEFLGYALCCGTHFAGPVFLMKDYLSWQEFRGVWSPEPARPAPSTSKPAVRALAQSLLACLVYLFLVTKVPLSFFVGPEYRTFPPWKAYLCMYIACLAVRFKYYFIWSISECALIVSGLGFTGWREEGKGEEGKAVATWQRAKNCDILGVELADSAAQFPLNWNISVSNWLRIYVYERLTPKGKKPGFWELMATQVVSAIWHGLYPGYLLYFTGSALMIGGSRVIYRFQRTIPEHWRMTALLARVAHGMYGSFVNNYAATGFLVLNAYDTVMAWRGVYFTGTLIPLAICVLGAFVKPPRAPRPKKEE